MFATPFRSISNGFRKSSYPLSQKLFSNRSIFIQPHESARNMKIFIEKRDYPAVLREIQTALSFDSSIDSNNVPLQSRELSYGLIACSQITDSSAELGFDIFSRFQQLDTIPLVAFQKIMEICSRKLKGVEPIPDHSQKALEIAQLFQEKGFSPNARFQSALISTLCRSTDQNILLLVEKNYFKFTEILEHSFENNENAQFHCNLFQDLMQHFRKDQAMLTRIFTDLTRFHVAIQPAVYSSQFQQALTEGNVPFLLALLDYHSKVLTTTYPDPSPSSSLNPTSTNPSDPASVSLQGKPHYLVRFDFGSLNRLMQVSSAKGSPELAEKGLELLAAFKYQSTISQHACRVRAYTQHRNFLGTLQAICQSESQGIHFDQLLFDMTSSSPSSSTTTPTTTTTTTTPSTIPSVSFGGSRSYAEDLSQLLGKSLSRSLTDMDDLYYLCVDLVPRNVPIPKLVLDAILISSCLKGQTDRTFATFQEFTSLFNVKPDAFSFNCLLQSVSLSRTPNVSTVLKIFQSMQQNNTNPDGRSLSLLLDTMVSANDLSALDQVSQMSQEQQLLINPKTLRRVALHFAKIGEWNEVEKVRKLLSSNPEANTPWPVFFQERLSTIQKQHKLEEEAKAMERPQS